MTRSKKTKKESSVSPSSEALAKPKAEVLVICKGRKRQRQLIASPLITEESTAANSLTSAKGQRHLVASPIITEEPTAANLWSAKQFYAASLIGEDKHSDVNARKSEVGRKIYDVKIQRNLPEKVVLFKARCTQPTP